MVWLPFQFAFRVLFAATGIVGISGSKAVQSSSSAISPDVSTTILESAVPTTTAAGVPVQSDQVSEEEEDRLIDKIGKMVEEGEEQEDRTLDEILAEEKQKEEKAPRNPKKRMMEGERDVMREEL